MYIIIERERDSQVKRMEIEDTLYYYYPQNECGMKVESSSITSNLLNIFRTTG